MKMLLVVATCLLLPFASQAQTTKTDDQIAQILIDQSIRSYPGACPCPYNVMRNGRSCGRRSAYSKPGGYAPLCYRGDVSKEDIDRYRRQTSGRAGK